MKKFAVLGILLFSLAGGAIAAETEIVDPEVPTVTEEKPIQTTHNKKGFAGINYNRQDIEEPGRQLIINDHSAFNININIFKKGALFKKSEEKEN